ncbi:MAG: ribbon-helix-helix domain-containing protein [Candidatus Heimdallarchaeota archaeon]
MKALVSKRRKAKNRGNIKAEVKKLDLIAFKIPERLIQQIDRLVRAGKFASRSEAIRYAIHSYLKAQEGIAQ